MPNDCWNHITVTCEDKEFVQELKKFVANELQYYDGEKPKYHETVKMLRQGKQGIIFEIWSAWNPNYKWLESLLSKYPNCWIKNEWNEEGGYAGVWVGFVKDNAPVIQSLQWEDLSIEAKHYLFLPENHEQE